MNMWLFFLLVAGISFAGSLHPGPVNLTVIQTTLQQNWRAGIWVAVGGSLPESVYSALAAGGLLLLPVSSNWLRMLNYASVPLLLGIGIVTFFQKPKPVSVATNGRINEPGTPFWKGIALAGTNPQLLPFWSSVWLYLQQAMLIPAHSWVSQWVFAVATSAGAFALLMGLVWLADHQRQLLSRHLASRWVNYVTGGLFIGMACLQLIPLFIR